MYDLALAVGTWDVEGMANRMSYAQLECWMMYQQLYGPINPIVRNDYAAAGIRAVIEANNPYRKKGSPRPKLEKNLIFPVEAKPRQTVQDQRNIMMQLVAASAGRSKNSG